MGWRDLSISTKLAAVFGSILVIVSVICFYAISGLSNVGGKARNALACEDIRGELLQREVDHLKWSAKLGDYVASSSSGKLDVQTDPKLCGFGKWYYSDAKVKAAALLPEAKDLFDRIERPHIELHGTATEIEAFKNRGDQQGVERIYREVTKARLFELQALLSEIGKKSGEKARFEEEKFTDTANGTRWLVTVVSAVAFPLCMVIGFLLSQSVSRPATRGVHFARKLEEGDLTARLDMNHGDEIGKLGQALDRMAVSLREAVTTMGEGVAHLNSSSARVKGVAKELRESTHLSSGKVNESAAAAEQMSANMLQAAAMVQQTNSNVQMVAAASEQLTATIHEIAKSAESARKVSEGAVAVATSTVSTMDELSKAAEEIGVVTKTISDISEQTKLLALNATIEAARAGEAGRGFSVVANEIKELARQVAIATGDIAQRVEGIRAVSHETRGGIDKMSGVIKEVNSTILTIASAVEEQSATVADIARNAQEVSDSMSEAARVVEETSIASRQVTDDVHTIKSQIVSIDDRTIVLESNSGELAQVSDRLTQLCGKFRI